MADEHHYILAGLTADERAIKRVDRIPLGTDFDKIDAALKQIHAVAQAALARNQHDAGALAQVVTIRALWIWWCYTATDIGLLKGELNAATKARETMGNTIAELEASVVNLVAKVAALEKSK